MSEREPCPYCGAPSEEISEGECLSERDGKYFKQTGCTRCGALGPEAPCDNIYDNGPANEAWDRRVPAVPRSEAQEEAMLERINNRLTGGGCPVAGKSLGECPAIGKSGTTPDGQQIFVAYIYLWDDSFVDYEQLAQWFIDEGAVEVIVAWHMHDTVNNDRNGRTEENTRAFAVNYTMPRTSGAVSSKRRYKFRAECASDVTRLSMALKVRGIDAVIVGGYQVDESLFSDCEAEIETAIELYQLREIMNLITDGHVMAESVNYLGRYDGERRPVPILDA